MTWFALITGLSFGIAIGIYIMGKILKQKKRERLSRVSELTAQQDFGANITGDTFTKKEMEDGLRWAYRRGLLDMLKEG